MEKFLNKNVRIETCLGGIDGCCMVYRGLVTGFDDEYVCLDDSLYIVRKYILSIRIK